MELKGRRKAHNFIKKCRQLPHPTLSISCSGKKKKPSLNSDYFSFAFVITGIFSYKVQLRKIFLFYEANLSKIQINSLMHFLHKLIMNKHNPVALRTDAIQ